MKATREGVASPGERKREMIKEIGPDLPRKNTVNKEVMNVFRSPTTEKTDIRPFPTSPTEQILG